MSYCAPNVLLDVLYCIITNLSTLNSADDCVKIMNFRNLSLECQLALFSKKEASCLEVLRLVIGGFHSMNSVKTFEDRCENGGHDCDRELELAFSNDVASCRVILRDFIGGIPYHWTLKIT
jgi:hypothetical protein